MYDLGADGQGMSRVATMAQNSIVAAAGKIARFVSWFQLSPLSEFFFLHIYLILSSSFSCRTIDRSVFRPIVHIAVIDRSESSDCHLLAVTHAG